ncbi:MAG: hypothetical protein Q9226_002972 [Calogaya cf. arnoldii]
MQPEVRSERSGIPTNDNEHDLPDAFLAALDAQLHEQSSGHASTVATITTAVNQIHNQSSALRESGPEPPSPNTHQTPNARALPSASCSLSLPFKISATEISTSYPLNTVGESQRHAISTDREQGPSSIRRTEATDAAALRNDHDIEASTGTTALQSITTEISTQPPTSPRTSSNSMASNVFGTSGKRKNDDQNSGSKRSREDEEAAAQFEIEAGNLVEDIQSNVPGASNHSQTDRAPTEDPVGDRSEKPTVDLLEVSEALEQTAIQLCLALVETKDGINEIANLFQDESQLLAVCKEITSCINGALEELIGHPDALKRVLNSLPGQTVQDFNEYRHGGLSSDT